MIGENGTVSAATRVAENASTDDVIRIGEQKARWKRAKTGVSSSATDELLAKLLLDIYFNCFASRLEIENIGARERKCFSDENDADNGYVDVLDFEEDDAAPKVEIEVKVENASAEEDDIFNLVSSDALAIVEKGGQRYVKTLESSTALVEIESESVDGDPCDDFEEDDAAPKVEIELKVQKALAEEDDIFNLVSSDALKIVEKGGQRDVKTIESSTAWVEVESESVGGDPRMVCLKRELVDEKFRLETRKLEACGKDSRSLRSLRSADKDEAGGRDEYLGKDREAFLSTRSAPTYDRPLHDGKKRKNKRLKNPNRKKRQKALIGSGAKTDVQKKFGEEGVSPVGSIREKATVDGLNARCVGGNSLTGERTIIKCSNETGVENVTDGKEDASRGIGTDDCSSTVPHNAARLNGLDLIQENQSPPHLNAVVPVELEVKRGPGRPRKKKSLRGRPRKVRPEPFTSQSNALTSKSKGVGPWKVEPEPLASHSNAITSKSKVGRPRKRVSIKQLKKAEAEDWRKRYWQYFDVKDGDDKATCRLCQWRVNSRTITLTQHLKYDHGMMRKDDSIQALFCEEPGCTDAITFNSHRDYVLHKQIVHKQFRRYTQKVKDETEVNVNHVCSICGSLVKNLPDHVSREHRPKISCPHPGCGKLIAELSLRSHMGVHSAGICPHPDCNMTFKTKIRLGNHVRRVHQSRRTHQQCPHCHIETIKTHLKTHIEEMHNSERSMYPCSEPGCGQVFKRNRNLNQHSKLHLKIKPFQCVWCDFTGTQHNNIRSHALTNHRENLSKLKPHMGEKYWRRTGSLPLQNSNDPPVPSR